MLELLGISSFLGIIIFIVICFSITISPIFIWHYCKKINARIEELNKGQDIQIQLLEEIIEFMKKG